MPRFCPKCGKSINKDQSFCNDCISSTINIKELKIIKCPSCNKILFRNKWKNQSIKYIIEKELKKQLHDSFEIKLLEKEDKFILKKTEGEYLIPYIKEKRQCQRCSRASGNYFEAIFQLRGEKEELKENIVFIKNFLNKKKDKVFLNKIKELKTGMDFYVSKKNYARTLGNKLINTYGGYLKISEQLFSRDKQTCKDLFRLNIFYKPPKFKVNDVIQVNNQIIKVENMSKNLKGHNIIKNKRTTLDYQNEEVKILKKYKTNVSKIHPNLEVIHPKTFQSVSIANPTEKQINEKVKVILFKNKIYLV